MNRSTLASRTLPLALGLLFAVGAAPAVRAGDGFESAWQFILDLFGLDGGGSHRSSVSTTVRRVPSASSGDVVPPRVPEIPDTLAEGDPVASPPVRVEPEPPPPPPSPPESSPAFPLLPEGWKPPPPPRGRDGQSTLLPSWVAGAPPPGLSSSDGERTSPEEAIPSFLNPLPSPPPPPVPEPSSLLLLAGGGSLLLASRRRRRRATRSPGG